MSRLVREEEVRVLAEEVRQYPSYSTASVASCQFVDGGRDKIDPLKLELYVSRLGASPAYGKVVGGYFIDTGAKPPTCKPDIAGVGLRTAAGVVVPYVRLDMDNTGKGIHFNATQLSDQNKKLAAVITPTVSMRPEERTVLYMDYIKGIENRSAQFIWQWWSTGQVGLPPV